MCSAVLHHVTPTSQCLIDGGYMTSYRYGNHEYIAIIQLCVKYIQWLEFSDRIPLVSKSLVY